MGVFGSLIRLSLSGKHAVNQNPEGMTSNVTLEIKCFYFLQGITGKNWSVWDTGQFILLSVQRTKKVAYNSEQQYMKYSHKHFYNVICLYLCTPPQWIIHQTITM